MSGPDYVSMAAGEPENPRIVMPRAYRQGFVRLMVSFILGSLAVGINAAYNDPTLATALTRDTGGAAASSYVIGMIRLRCCLMSLMQLYCQPLSALVIAMSTVQAEAFSA